MAKCNCQYADGYSSRQAAAGVAEQDSSSFVTFIGVDVLFRGQQESIALVSKDTTRVFEARAVFGIGCVYARLYLDDGFAMLLVQQEIRRVVAEFSEIHGKRLRGYGGIF